MNEETIRAVIEQVLRELGQGDGVQKEHGPGGTLLVRTAQVRCAPFEGRRDVRVQDVTTLSEAPRMGAGVMEVEGTEFPWTLTYDEYDLVLSGTLEVKTGDGCLRAGPGDLIYIPKDTAVRFCSPDLARYVYVTYPADWNH